MADGGWRIADGGLGIPVADLNPQSASRNPQLEYFQATLLDVEGAIAVLTTTKATKDRNADPENPRTREPETLRP
jgi:hypothetical protein